MVASAMVLQLADAVLKMVEEVVVVEKGLRTVVMVEVEGPMMMEVVEEQALKMKEEVEVEVWALRMRAAVEEGLKVSWRVFLIQGVEVASSQ